MPYCSLSSTGAKLFYRTYGNGTTKVLMIIGLAATHEAWGPQIKGLTDTGNDDDEKLLSAVDSESGGGVEEKDGVEICCFDNRGVGKSFIPNKKSEYSTTIMAKDALVLLDHLGWTKAHVFGHSMGAMIACKLAAIAPNRVLSLALLNATGGGFECLPKLDRQMLSLAYRFLKAKTPEERAAVDLDTHYTKEYLDELVGTDTRRKILHQEYVKAISSSGMQLKCGFDGQLNACWTHRLTSKELDTIRSAGFLIYVIHGRYDIIAQMKHARKLAEKLQPAARMVGLHGGHLVSHERPDEVNQALIALIKSTKSKLKPQDWSNFIQTKSGWILEDTSMSTSSKNYDGENFLTTFYNLVGKLQLLFLYFIGVFVMCFEQLRKVTTAVKPVRVSASN